MNTKRKFLRKIILHNFNIFRHPPCRSLFKYADVCVFKKGCFLLPDFHHFLCPLYFIRCRFVIKKAHLYFIRCRFFIKKASIHNIFILWPLNFKYVNLVRPKTFSLPTFLRERPILYDRNGFSHGKKRYSGDMVLFRGKKNALMGVFDIKWGEMDRFPFCHCPGNSWF